MFSVLKTVIILLPYQGNAIKIGAFVKEVFSVKNNKFKIGGVSREPLVMISFWFTYMTQKACYTSYIKSRRMGYK